MLTTKTDKHRWIDLASDRSCVFLSLAACGQPQPSQILDQYRNQRITWTTNIWPFANTLFGILATIEFPRSAAVMLLRGPISNHGQPRSYAK